MPQSPFDLLELGKQAAQEAGVQAPSRQQRLHYGFVAIARQMPLACRGEEVEALVRLTLFDQRDGITDLPQERRQLIRDRVDAALDRHWDDATPNFNEWYWGRRNSFVKQISKTGRNSIDRHEVRLIELELGWEAYHNVAKNIEAVLLEVMAGMPEPLNAVEQGWFAHLFLPQGYYAGLPLALIAERLPFIEQAVWDVGNGPDERAIGVLHRLLHFYSEMIVKRRDADRSSKVRSARRTARFGALVCGIARRIKAPCCYGPKLPS